MPGCSFGWDERSSVRAVWESRESCLSTGLLLWWSQETLLIQYELLTSQLTLASLWGGSEKNLESAWEMTWCSESRFCLCAVTWRRVSVHGGLDHQGAPFGRHGHRHLPLYVSRQHGLDRLSVDVWGTETGSHTSMDTGRPLACVSFSSYQLWANFHLFLCLCYVHF